MTRAGRRPWTAVVAVVAAVALAAGCGSDAPSSEQSEAPTQPQFVNETRSSGPAVAGGRIVYGVPAETSSFNPVLASWASYSLTIARAIYDTLATFDDQSQVQPYLAERFEHNADFTVWTVTLREGVTYTNGEPFTAASFVDAQRQLKASPVLSEVFDAVIRWEVKDAKTFVMYSRNKWAHFPDAMASQIGVAVWPGWLTSDDIWHPVATGSFIVDRWDVEKQMVLRKNPMYWRKDTRGVAYPYLDQVTFRVIVDESARAEALRKGEIDLMMQTYATPSVRAMLAEAEAGTFQAFSDKRFETPEDYVLINTTRPPFDDIDARRALARALDLDDYVERVTGGLDEPADSPWAPGSPWYVPVDYPTYDPVEARRLVDAVRARNGGRFEVTLLGNPSTESNRIQQYVAEQWTKVGIDVKLDSVLQQTKIIKMIQGDFQLVLTQQFDNVNPGPETVYLQDWHKPVGELSLHFSRLDDPVITQLCIDGLAATGDDAREKYGLVSKRLAETIPFIWLAHASRTIVASPRVVNVVRADTPEGRPMLEFIQGSHPIHQIWLRR